LTFRKDEVPQIIAGRENRQSKIALASSHRLAKSLPLVSQPIEVIIPGMAARKDGHFKLPPNIMTQEQAAQFLAMFRTLTGKVANLESRLANVEEEEYADDYVIDVLRSDIDEFATQLEFAVLPEPEAAIAS
jgi:hypothetical protein